MLLLTCTLQLTLDDGREIETTWDTREVRDWEREHGMSALDDDAKLDLNGVTRMGWLAARREGKLNGTYDTFEAFDAACRLVRTVPKPDPPKRKAATRKGQSGG
jgi:hypothetical protein